MVGLIPLYACLVIDDEYVDKLPGFKKRMDWFLKHREDLRNEVCKTVFMSSQIISPTNVASVVSEVEIRDLPRVVSLCICMFV